LCNPSAQAGTPVVQLLIFLTVRRENTMSKKSLIAAAVGTAFAATVAAPVVSAASNPFALSALASGYQVADNTPTKPMEGKCGGAAKPAEGKCGAAAKHAEGKCGAGKDAKMKDGKCGATKKDDASNAEAGKTSTEK
jgi:uncharacterized low-complexity protein